MINVDRHIAIQAGWIGGPAFGVAMMAAPEYLHLGPIASAILFWGGIAVFLLTILVVMAISLHEEKTRKRVLGPIITMAVGALILCGGAAWYFWPDNKTQQHASATPDKPSPGTIPKLEDFFTKDFNFLSVDRTLDLKIENPADSFQINTTIKIRVFRDFDSNTEFVSIFVPFFSDARLHDAIEGVIDHLKIHIKQAREEAKLIGVEARSPGSSVAKSSDLIFSGRVFVYTMNSLDPVQFGRLVDAYRKDGMVLEIRGSDYLFYKMKS
jgi:hypothetical protein